MNNKRLLSIIVLVLIVSAINALGPEKQITINGETKRLIGHISQALLHTDAPFHHVYIYWDDQKKLTGGARLCDTHNPEKPSISQLLADSNKQYVLICKNDQYHLIVGIDGQREGDVLLQEWLAYKKNQKTKKKSHKSQKNNT